jgi:hypothetical protein
MVLLKGDCSTAEGMVSWIIFGGSVALPFSTMLGLSVAKIGCSLRVERGSSGALWL